MEASIKCGYKGKTIFVGLQIVWLYKIVSTVTIFSSKRGKDVVMKYGKRLMVFSLMEIIERTVNIFVSYF